MIKTEKGNLEVHGPDSEIMADISIIVRNVYEALSKEIGKPAAKARLKIAFDRAFLSDEELKEHNDAMDKVNKLLDRFMKFKEGEKND